jgi:hypothetical protein
VDRQGGTISLRDPWGWHRPEVTLSFEEFQGAFQRVSVNAIDAD